MQRAWLAAFEAATLSGLRTADPWDLARARGWSLTESVMADVRAAIPSR